MVKKAAFFLLILFLTLLIYISFFNRFQTDDYILAHHIKEAGNMHSFIETYNTWSGRYFSFLLAKNTSLIYNQYNFYPTAAPIFLLVTFFLGVRFLLKNFSGKEKITQKTLVFISVYFLLTFSLGEHLYWNSASKIYFFPFICYIYFLGFLLRDRKIPQTFNKFSQYLLVIIIIGSNEIIVVMTVVTLFLVYRESREKKILHLLLFSIILLIISFAAPGNFVRLNNSVDFSSKLKSILKLSIALPVLVLMKSLIAFPVFHLFFEKEIEKLNQSKISIHIIAAAVAGLMTIAFLGGGDTRTVDTFAIFLAIGLACILFKFKNVKKLAVFSLLIFLVPPVHLPPYKQHFFTFNYHYYEAIEDVISGDLQKFKSEIFEREKALQNSKEDSIVLEKIQHVPKSLYFSEIPSELNRNFINGQYEKYYHKKSVTTR